MTLIYETLLQSRCQRPVTALFGLRLEIRQGSLWEKWRAKVNSNPEEKGKVKGEMPNSVKITPVREARVPGRGIRSGNASSSGDYIPKLEFKACTTNEPI